MNRTWRSPGKVYLVGAGQGDPKFLTVMGAEVLKLADVVVHDDLVAPATLELAKPGALVLHAGKRAGSPSADQREINAALVEHARLGRLVVRLKGGDPFVFGRGGEEAEALERAGIEWEVVPGVIRREVPAASEHLPALALGSEGGGSIVTDPRDAHGVTAIERVFQVDVELPAQSRFLNVGGRAYIRFDHGREALARQWYRQARQIFLSRFNV